MLETTTPTILIGTASRLFDLYKEDSFDISRLQTLVVDEVDRIVEPISRYADMKTKLNRKVHVSPGEQLIEMIVRKRRSTREKRAGSGIQDITKSNRLQVIVSSATVNNPLRYVLKQKMWMVDPVYLSLNMTTPKRIKHVAYVLDERDMLMPLVVESGESIESSDSSILHTPYIPETSPDMSTLAESIFSICSMQKVQKALIFIHSGSSVIQLVENLCMLGLKADRLSNMHDYNTKTIGEKPFKAWTHGRTNIVVGTEFEARGLDIPDLTFVIIVGASSPQSYVHLSGRTGRFGTDGTAITLLTSKLQRIKYLQVLKSLNITTSN